jgi:hypothetical protein
MYEAIRNYTLRPGSCEEFLRRVQESFVPLISQASGFIAYDALPVGTDYVLTISDFDTRAGAEESILRALRWVQENGAELIQLGPTLQVKQVLTPSKLTSVLQAQDRQAQKRLVLDLSYEVLHPSALGDHAYTDPHVREMVSAIRSLLTQMRADPVGHDKVIYRFEGDLLPEEATKGLYEADHVILIKRGNQLAGYVEIDRDVNPWLRRERYEAAILVDPAVYHRDAQGQIVEKGIGVQGLLEMRRQGLLLGMDKIELDVYLRNQPMQRFMDHVIAKQRFPCTKQEMLYGRPLDYTYLLSCERPLVWRKGDTLWFPTS